MENDHSIEFHVVIRSYGNEDTVRRSVELNLCRALHNTFGDRAQIIAMPTGDMLHFDPLGDDGHHDGHDSAITRTPGSRMNARGPLAGQGLSAAIRAHADTNGPVVMRSPREAIAQIHAVPVERAEDASDSALPTEF